MLVLSRRTGESLVIGDDVVVTVLEVKGDGGVRLGIDAPRTTRVHRAEVYAAVKAANADASRAGTDPSGEQVAQLLRLAGRRADAPDASAPDAADATDPSGAGTGAGDVPGRPAGQAQDGPAPTGH